MINKGQITSEELKIQGLLDRYLQFRNNNSNDALNGDHLDEDSLTAFVEGKLSELETPFVLKHLVDCSFCLHVTSELTKLSAAFAEDEIIFSEPATEPTKVSDVLSGLLSRIFGANDGAVFAHQEQEKDKTEQEESS